MPAAVEPERVLRELAELWASLAKAEEGPATASGVLRACSMTLIVAATDADDAQEVSRTMAELMHEHPSRAIVLKPGPEGLEARVFAQCWMPFGGRQQICCEQIEITAGPDHLGDMPRMIYGLLAPDLPAVLWCRATNWLTAPEFQRVYRLIDKLIVDTRGFRDGREALALIGDLRRRAKRVGDLAWTALTFWREMIAHAFETPAGRASVGHVKKIRVVHGQRAASSGWYLAAWLARALPNAQVQVEADPHSDTSDMRLVELEAEGATFRLEAGEGTTVMVDIGAPPHPVVPPPATDCTTMREELSITGADPVFDEVLPLAVKLAGGA